uniref:palmdelphin isoform X1 n=1 Tax=Oncorhynchus gorbuscha TaxID=8017 RepID=UPI001EAF5B7B|nr:palmdelphin isoform X1 [Oncorhynchus gorbuscha]XP_046216144.1 palmdelphin isoform X1 [Oncorhynchus gorbuscha]
MEEADLVKERLQAITDKRKVQEDIAHKKLEIDKEKLKLQHLKKKSLREQWLMDGAAIQSPQQRETLRGDQQQSKLLQTSIHRIEKEIEAMEREETMISKNEGFILKRLKAIEKTPEEIIKEANENFKEATLDVPKFYKPQMSRKQSFKFNKDTPKQTMFAMEINVQKDLRTGESRVLSTSTVTPQELQQRGVKVYDDGRKSVYALQSDGSHLGNGVDELSPIEVEELLRAATEQKKSQRGPRSHQGHQESAPAFSPNYSPRGHQEPVPVISPNFGPRGHQEAVPAFSPNYSPRGHQEPVPAFSPNCGSRGHQEAVPAFSTPCGPRSHQELSPMEVEKLLRKAIVQKMPQSGAFPQAHQVHQESVPAFSTTSGRSASASNRPQQSHAKVLQGANGNGYQQELYEHDVLSRKELHYIDGVHYSGPESLSSSPHIPVPSFICRNDEEYTTNGYNQNPFSYGGEFHPTHNSYHSPRESQQGGMFYNSSAKKDQKPSPIYQEDLHFSILNAIDTSEPITAIFMGYQTAKDDSGRGLGYEGSIRAEIVVIGDEDGVDESNPQLNTYDPDGCNHWGYHHSQPQQKLIQYMAEPTANINANNASPYTASKKLVYPGQQAKEACYPYSDGQLDRTERHPVPGIRKIQMIQKRKKPCCMLM